LMGLKVLRNLLRALLGTVLGSFLLLRIKDYHMLGRIVTPIVSDVL
jgi:hypothetical protein